MLVDCDGAWDSESRRVGIPIVICVVAVLWVTWVVLAWSVMLLEKRRPLRLTSIEPDDPRMGDIYMQKMRQEAEAAGFVMIGTYVDSYRGWLKGAITIMLSGDGVTMLRILHAKTLHKLALASALTNDVWVVTMSIVGDPDCSGLSDEEAVPTSKSLAPVLEHHLKRLVNREHEVIPWNPEEMVKDLEERDRHKVGRLLELGAVRVRDQMTGRWSYTIKGAAAQRRAMNRFWKQAMAEVKAEMKEKGLAKKLAKPQDAP